MESTQSTPDRDEYLWRQVKARVGFRMHLRSYLIVNTGLWLIWAFSSFAVNSFDPDHIRWIFPWPIFPMLGWGIGLASHYVHVYRGGSERSMIEEEYQKLLNQRV